MDTVYKTVPFELAELKASDGGGWQFSGYASTFGNVDLGNDVMMRGAFDASLERRKKRRLLWQHDLAEPIGVEVSLKPDDRGLYGTWKIVDTARGTDAHKLLKAGAVDSMSIGYQPLNVEFDDVGIRKLLEVDLLECSVVSLPMNEQAIVTQVKASPEAILGQILKLEKDEPFADVLAQIGGFLKVGVEAAEALRARRADDGRMLSDAHRHAIDDLVAEAKASTDRLERVLKDPELAEACADDSEFRAQLRQRLAQYRARESRL